VHPFFAMFFYNAKNLAIITRNNDDHSLSVSNKIWAELAVRNSGTPKISGRLTITHHNFAMSFRNANEFL